MWFFFGTMWTPRLCAACAKKAGLGGEREGRLQLRNDSTYFWLPKPSCATPTLFGWSNTYHSRCHQSQAVTTVWGAGLQRLGGGKINSNFSAVCGRNKLSHGTCYFIIKIQMRLFFSLNISLQHRSYILGPSRSDNPAPERSGMSPSLKHPMWKPVGQPQWFFKTWLSTLQDQMPCCSLLPGTHRI